MQHSFLKYSLTTPQSRYILHIATTPILLQFHFIRVSFYETIVSRIILNVNALSLNCFLKSNKKFRHIDNNTLKIYNINRKGDIKVNIGNIIKELRESNNLTQEALGKIIGVNKTTVNRYETGEIDIKRTTAIKLAETFDVPPAYIMGWSTEKKGQQLQIEEFTSEEIEIIKKYREMSYEGKRKLKENISDLYIADKFKKMHGSVGYKTAAWGADETEGTSQSPIEEITT